MGASATQTGPSQAEPEVSALRASVPCAALSDLIYQSVRFALWAAGEGLSPVEGEDAEAPDEFFYRYSRASGDESWETIPDRLAAALNNSERRFIDAIMEQSPNGEQIIVQYHPNGDWFVAASAIEAHRAKTGTGSVHESAAPQEDAR